MNLVLVGNPNVGKSVLFGCLTGRYVHVANYPGTTVEVAEGELRHGGRRFRLVDTPGIQTMVPLSEDQEVTRNILLDNGTGPEKVDGIIQVVDAKNLRRALLLSLEIAETGRPFLLNLNMEDEAEERGIAIDKERLSEILGVPVIGTTAVENAGIPELKEHLNSLKTSRIRIDYPEALEEAIHEITPHLPDAPLSRRSIALMLLSGDQTLKGWMKKKNSPAAISRVQDIIDQFSHKHQKQASSRQASSMIYRARWDLAARIASEVVKKTVNQRTSLRERFERLTLRPVSGYLILAAVLAGFYFFVGKFGAQTAVGWLEQGLFGKWVNPFVAHLVSGLPVFFRDLLVGPYGLFTMALTYAFAIILPIVTTFFVAFSLMEDSGYLPRVAALMDKGFRLLGLNGKAVIPMILGLGCDTMATMTARIMETKKEKVILTLLLALGVPCSAQLGIILGMLASLPFWATCIWLGVVIGSLLAVGLLASKILKGRSSDFILEIPPLRRPTFTHVLIKTVARLEWYLKEVVPLFVIGTFALFLLDKLHWLSAIQSFFHPVVAGLLDLPPEATEAFLIGFLRRDYGATHFFSLFTLGRIDAIQATVALVVMTLFVPCLANFLMIIKERGMKTAWVIAGFIYPFAFGIGAILNGVLRW